MKYILNSNQLEGLNKILDSKNDISILNNYGETDLSDKDESYLIKKGILNEEASLGENEIFDILANPSTITKFMITGGANKYEHIISYDESEEKQVAFSTSPEYFIIDDNVDNKTTINTIVDFLGSSSLKSLNINIKLSAKEAIVLGGMLDLERRSLLRAFVDELPYTNNKYGVNMIWRMIHEYKESIQWLVYNLSEVIGQEISLELDQVKEILDELAKKGLLTEEYGQYQLNEDYSKLANRMIILDNIMTFEMISNSLQKSVGFVCIQSGVHDILIIDYDGNDLLLETVSSQRLLEYIERLLKGEII